MGMSPAPMLPPDIRQQGGPQAPAPPPIFMQAGQAMGQGGPSASDPLAMLEQKLSELEKWASETMLLVDQVHKPAGALLVPIAKAGQALKNEVAQLKERKAKSGGAAVAGGRSTPNPAEGVPNRQAA